MKRHWLLALMIGAVWSEHAPAQVVEAGKESTLPPLEAFVRRDAYSQVSLSPDGRQLAAIMPINGHQNLALIDLDKRTVVALTALASTDVSSYDWISDRTLEIRTANLADELGVVELQQRVIIDTEGHVVRDLKRAANRTTRGVDTIGGTGYTMEVIDDRGRSGDDLIVEANDRNVYSLDAYHYNPRTGEKQLLTVRTPGEVRDFVVDHAGQVRLAHTSQRDEERQAWWYRKSNDDDWVKLTEAAAEEETMEPLAFDYDNRTLYVAVQNDTKGGRREIHTYDTDTRQVGPLVYESVNGETGRPRFDRVTERVVGFGDSSSNGVHWIDPAWEAIQHGIDQALPGHFNRISWAAYAPERLIVASSSESSPTSYYLFDRKTGRLEEVASARPALDKFTLGTRKFVRYKARDGLSIPAYLTLPPGGVTKNLPLVVIIHGGPYVPATRRGFDAEAHLLASRGYAVLQPDFRGTQGYGDAFYKAGWRQWGLAMQDDVTDGVRWLIDEGTVDADRVCLYGASYGGYATLWGLEKEPGMFRCGVAFVAVSNLESMFDVGWSDIMEDDRGGSATSTLTRWIGDPGKDRDKMRAVSPVFHADRIQAPLLLAYGGADRRVPATHGFQMRSALDRYGKTYEWVVYNDEGHGFNKDENRLDFARRVDAFLAKNLAPRTPPKTAAADPIAH